jgi:hypothetical protein
MAMGKRKSDQAPLWAPTTNLPVSPGHPFYVQLNTMPEGDDARGPGFDAYVEELENGASGP